MSSKNNVNKDFYTLAGRDRPNEVVMEPKHRPDERPGRRRRKVPLKTGSRPRRRAA